MTLSGCISSPLENFLWVCGRVSSNFDMKFSEQIIPVTEGKIWASLYLIIFAKLLTLHLKLPWRKPSVCSVCLTLSQDIVRTVWNDVGYLQKLSKINCRQHKEFSNLTSAIQVELIEVSRVVLSWILLHGHSWSSFRRNLHHLRSATVLCRGVVENSWHLFQSDVIPLKINKWSSRFRLAPKQCL